MARREREMLRELRRFHRENDCGDADAPTATQLAKKRLRVPAVDVDANPFCAERQLADEYERMNFNKNPRFYAVALDTPPVLRENPRNYSSFINQAADRIASSGVSPRARAEFSSLRPAPSYEPPVAQFSSPTVFSVDPSNLRRDHKDGGGPNRSQGPFALPSAHKQYGVRLTKQTVTFGHRPGSGGRMYDRLTDSITAPGSVRASASSCPSSSRSSNSVATSRRSSPVSMPVKTGMSVMALAQLLTAPTAASSGPSSTVSGFKSVTDDAGDSGDDGAASDNGDQGEDARLRRRRRRVRREERRRRDELQALERQYQNAVFNPPKERRAPQFLPPTDQSTAQLIDKYRKLAVGKLPGVNDAVGGV